MKLAPGTDGGKRIIPNCVITRTRFQYRDHHPPTQSYSVVSKSIEWGLSSPIRTVRTRMGRLDVTARGESVMDVLSFWFEPTSQRIYRLNGVVWSSDLSSVPHPFLMLTWASPG